MGASGAAGGDNGNQASNGATQGSSRVESDARITNVRMSLSHES